MLAWTLPGLLTVLFHPIVLCWSMEISFGESRADSKIVKFMHYWAGSRCLVCIQAASSNACIIDRKWQTVLIYACINIDKQSSNTLTLMYKASQSIQHLRWLQVIISSLYEVRLVRLMKLDTLPDFFYYDFLLSSMWMFRHEMA